MKTKKILSLLMSVAMICTMFTAFSVSASAAGENIVNISDPATLTSKYFEQFTEDTTVILQNDMVLTQGLRFCARKGVNLTVKSANPKNPVTLTSTKWACASGFDKSDWSGNIVLKDFNIVSNVYSFEIYPGVNLTMDNMTIRSDLATVAAFTGYCAVGFYNVGTPSENLTANVTMKNCTIDGGDNGTQTNGIDIFNKANLSITNSTILGGTGNGTEVGFTDSGHGIYCGENLTDNQITITNSTVKGGKTVKGAAGMGVRCLSGTLTINNSNIHGGAAEEAATMGAPLSLYKSKVTVNGGDLIPGNDISSLPANGGYYIQQYSNYNDTTTLVINPTFSMVGSQVKMFPALEGVTVSVNGTGSATTDKKGMFSGLNFADVITSPDTIALLNSYTATVNNKTPFTITEQGTPVTATTTIPAPTYTVTIPETVSFGDHKQALEKYRNETNDQFGKAVVVSKDFTVSATGVANLFNDLDDNKADYINVTATFDGILKGSNNATNTVPYTLSQNSTTLADGAKIATFYNDVDLASKGKTNSATATITINRADIKNADSYQGTMTFTIAVANR